MPVFYRLIAGPHRGDFPTRNRDFIDFFKESSCSQGVCFAFCIFFLKQEKINLSQESCRNRLVGLQLSHEAAIKNEQRLLTKADLDAYGVKFVEKLVLANVDISTIKNTLDHWVCGNKQNPTRVILSLSIPDHHGVFRKHMSPIMFDPAENKWAVGDTTFALDEENTVVRSVMPSTSLECYLEWQIKYVIGYYEEPLMLTLFHVKLRK